jgi:hypothetical protein
MSLPDMGLGMIPTTLPGTTGMGCSATVAFRLLLGRPVPYWQYVAGITGVKELQRVASKIARARAVSAQEWEAAHRELLVKEKELT